MHSKLQQQLSSSWDGRAWPQQTWAEKRGLLCPFRGELGPRLTMWPGLRSTSVSSVPTTNWRLHPSSCLATIDLNRILGAVPLLGGAATPSNTTSPGWGCALFLGSCRVPIEHKVAWSEAYFHTKWHRSPSSRFGHNGHWPKMCGCAP